MKKIVVLAEKMEELLEKEFILDLIEGRCPYTSIQIHEIIKSPKKFSECFYDWLITRDYIEELGKEEYDLSDVKNAAWIAFVKDHPMLSLDKAYLLMKDFEEWFEKNKSLFLVK